MEGRIMQFELDMKLKNLQDEPLGCRLLQLRGVLVTEESEAALVASASRVGCLEEASSRCCHG
jgi:hypothetical protein